MAKKELLVIADYSEESLFTIEELCKICGIPESILHDLILHDIAIPLDESQEQLVFNLTQLQRIKTTLRLQHDLEVNLAGAAVILDLLEERERLLSHLLLLEKHFL